MNQPVGGTVGKRRKRGSALAALLVAYALLGIYYNVTSPVLEAPDETMHFSYVNFIRATGQLPVYGRDPGSESFQPPLYYALAALVTAPVELTDSTGMYWPNPRFSLRGPQVNYLLHGSLETFPYEGRVLALRLARALSTCFGGLAIAATVALGWELFPERPVVGWLAGALLAFNPQFLFLGAAVSNDGPAAGVTVLGWWVLLRVFLREAAPSGAATPSPVRLREWLVLGVIAGAALLTKTTGAMLGILAGLALAACTWRRPRRLVAAELTLVLSVLLVAGWWLVRNQITYGDPLGWAPFQQQVRAYSFRWSDLVDSVAPQFTTYWAKFGAMAVPAPEWFYQLVAGLGVLGLLGLGGQLLAGRLDRRVRLGLGLLAAALAAQELFVLALVARCGPDCSNGRLIFPVAGPLVLLMSAGLIGWLPPRPAAGVAAAVTAGLIALALFVPVGVIAPAYPVVALPKWQLWWLPQRTDYVYGETFALRGYRVERRTAGQVLTLYWQAPNRPACDCTVSLEALDGAGRSLGFHGHMPGAERGYLPSEWLPGDIVADEYVLDGQATQVRVGVYNPDAYAGWPVSSGGDGPVVLSLDR
jgi:hypothetical protein